jgi:hypothetical protein
VVHWSALQQALEMGFVLTEVTAVVSYKQMAWMKPFVELCAGMRKKAQAEDNQPLSDMCKLMMNSAFGKTIEDPRGRLNIALFSHTERLDKKQGLMSARRLALRHIMSERFTNVHRVSDDLFIITKKPKIALFNKPVSTGQALLDYSKVHMLDMHYHIQAQYGKAREREAHCHGHRLADLPHHGSAGPVQGPGQGQETVRFLQHGEHHAFAVLGEAPSRARSVQVGVDGLTDPRGSWSVPEGLRPHRAGVRQGEP